MVGWSTWSLLWLKTKLQQLGCLLLTLNWGGTSKIVINYNVKIGTTLHTLGFLDAGSTLQWKSDSLCASPLRSQKSEAAKSRANRWLGVAVIWCYVWPIIRFGFSPARLGLDFDNGVSPQMTRTLGTRRPMPDRMSARTEERMPERMLEYRSDGMSTECQIECRNVYIYKMSE